MQAQVVPWKLWAAVAGLLAIDVVLLLVWTLVDPLSREVSLVMSWFIRDKKREVSTHGK